MRRATASLIGAVLALLTLAVLVVCDLSVPPDYAILTSLFGLAPLIACAVVPPRGTAVIAALALVAAVLSGVWNDTSGTAQHNVRLVNVVLVGAPRSPSLRCASSASALRRGVADRPGRPACHPSGPSLTGRPCRHRGPVPVRRQGRIDGRRSLRLLPLRGPHPANRRRRPGQGDRRRWSRPPASSGPSARPQQFARRCAGSPVRWTTTWPGSSARKSSSRPCSWT